MRPRYRSPGCTLYAWAMPTASPTRPRAHLPWRLLSMFYDMWPVLALWFLLSFLFNLAYTLAGHEAHEYIQPFTLLGWLLWICCWVAGGLYVTVSWRRGGQTLGMRPWRLRLVNGEDPGIAPSWRAVWVRYAVGTASLLLGGLGFFWALVDRDRLAWHDRASGTRLVRVPKR